MLVDSLCVQLPTFLKKSRILFRSGSCTEASWRTEKIELYVFVHQYFFIICFVVRCISGDYWYSRFEVEIRCLILYFSLTEITNPGGGDSHMKQTGMLVVSLRGVNFGFWSRLGCSGQSTNILCHQGLI